MLNYIKNKQVLVSTLSLIIFTSCGGGGGGSSDPDPVIPTPTPSVSISIDVSEAFINDDVTVTWSSTNASSCSASGSWNGTKGTSGSEVKYFVTTGSKTFTVECSGSGGSNSASASVTIAYKPIQTSRYTKTDGTDIFVDKGTNNIFHLGLIPRYLTKKHSGYTYGLSLIHI